MSLPEAAKYKNGQRMICLDPQGHGALLICMRKELFISDRNSLSFETFLRKNVSHPNRQPSRKSGPEGEWDA